MGARVAQEPCEIGGGQRVGERGIAGGQHPLPDQHLQPAEFGEQFLMLAGDAAIGAEQRQLVRQAIGDAHRPAIGPEGFGPAIGVIMQDQEIADRAPFEIGLAVELGDVRRVEAGAREQAQQPGDARLDQMDAGRFERLHEPRRQPERDAVLHPHRAPFAGGELQRARLGERCAVEPGEQDRRRAIVTQMRARIDDAVAGAVLERDAPLPARLARGGAGIGGQRLDARARHRQRTIARQPVGPILIAGV